MTTEKSFLELQNLKKKIDFILIGGWAVYFYTKALKSKDIDIVVDFDKLSILRKNYNLFKNARLNKYEAIKGEVQIDIYLPHFSRIGIPVEDLIGNVTNLEGFKVLDKDYLLALKIFVSSQRAQTPKGMKDFIDVVSLIHFALADLEKVKKILSKYKIAGAFKSVRDIAERTFEIQELNLNKHQFSKLRKLLLSS
ncbi:hypothetical protein KJ678_00255 [Patescibacteria group bacterium]|nr:hypothetical protein [Patescibacteria group bacterium]